MGDIPVRIDLIMTRENISIIAVFFIAITALSCAGKPITRYDTERADQRIIVVVPVDKNKEAAVTVEKAMDELYRSRFVLLPPIEKRCKNVCSSTLHRAGLAGADDAVIVSRQAEELVADLYALKGMNQYARIKVPYDENAEKSFKSALALKVRDLNINPKADRFDIADRLEARGELKMAYDVLKKKKEEEYSILLQDIDEKDAVDSRLRALEIRIRLKECYKKDANAKFALRLSREGLSDQYYTKFKKAIRQVSLIKELRKYTTKPARLKVQFSQAEADSSIWLEMRYNPKWFKAKMKKYPSYVKNKRVISFEPYMGIMSKLYELKERFAQLVPINQKDTILAFNTVFVLTKPCDDYLTITVSKGSSGEILYPYYIRLHLTGFKGETTLEPADKEIFNSKGMFALGPATLLSGEKTNYGILYDFLEIR